MGGAVSIRVAASRPDLLRTLTLVSPVLPDLLIRPELLRFPVAGLPVVGDWVMRRTQRVPAENRVAGVVATCYNDPAAMHPDRFWHDVAELKRRDGLSYSATTLSRAARTIVAENLRPRRYSLWRAAERITSARARHVRQPRQAGEPQARRSGAARVPRRYRDGAAADGSRGPDGAS